MAIYYHNIHGIVDAHIADAHVVTNTHVADVPVVNAHVVTNTHVVETHGRASLRPGQIETYCGEPFRQTGNNAPSMPTNRGDRNVSR